MQKCTDYCEGNIKCHGFSFSGSGHGPSHCALFATCSTLKSWSHGDSYNDQKAEASKGSGETTLAFDGTTEWSRESTLPAEEVTEGSGGTTLATERTTEGSGRIKPSVEGTTEVSEPDKTITKINEPATEAVIKSTLGTKQTTFVTTETTKGTPNDYENTVQSISPQVTKIPRIVTTTAFTEGNSGEETRRWPKDVPLIKQITGNYGLHK